MLLDCENYSRAGELAVVMRLMSVVFRPLLPQARRPSGFVGRFVSRSMARQNKESNDWTVSLLDVLPTDRVLEVGFGPGTAIKSVVELASEGFVTGIDFSETMVQQASKLNAAGIAAGRVELKCADVSPIRYEDDSFDKVYAVNVIYLWDDLRSVVKELGRVLRSKGILALYMAPPELMDMMGVSRSPLFTVYDVDDVVKVLEDAGFGEVSVKTKAMAVGTASCVLATK